LAGATNRVAHSLLGSWPGQHTKLHISQAETVEW
jgi:hypothetical protein